MSNNSLGELYFIIIMMVLILIVCVVAVYVFVRQYRREMSKTNDGEKNTNKDILDEQTNPDQE